MRPHGMKNLLLVLLFIALPTFAADPATAGLEALRLAAEQGNADAQYELGILYEFGYHFSDHNSAAYGWYSRSAEQGNALAAKRRDILKSQLSPAEIERSQALTKSQSPAAAPGSTAATR
jgi:TPR repeat protein